MRTKLKIALFTVCAAFTAAGIACGGDDSKPNNPADAGADHTSPPLDAAMDTNPPPPPVDGGADAPPPLPTGQINRMGRPAVNTALNLHKDTAGGAKDMYNQELTIQDWSMNHKYDSNFDTFLHVYDVFGGDAVDWPLADGGTQHPLREPLKLDVLIIDTNKECTAANGFCENGYLEIEAQLLLGGPAHQTCGGRTLKEDVIDKTLSLLILGPTRGAPQPADGGLAYPIGDGVSQATKLPTHTFPYMAGPN